MPPYADFLALDRNDHDRGFRVGEGLGVDEMGRVVLRLGSSSPLYVDGRGDVNIRVGDGVEMGPGSPVRLVAKGDPSAKRAAQEALASAAVATAAVSTLSGTVATNTTNIATNTTDIATLAADKAEAVDVTAVETDLDAAELAIMDLQTDLASLETLFDAQILDVVLMSSDSAAVTLTNISPAGADSLMPAAGVTTYIVPADLTGYSECRLIVHRNSGTCGAGTTVHLRYRATLSATVGDYSQIGTSAVSVLIDDTVGTRPFVQKTAWIALDAGAIADVFLAPVCSGGDGASDPTIGYIRAQFRR